MHVGLVRGLFYRYVSLYERNTPSHQYHIQKLSGPGRRNTWSSALASIKTPPIWRGLILGYGLALSPPILIVWVEIQSFIIISLKIIGETRF
jgi:hypothetical protein